MVTLAESKRLDGTTVKLKPLIPGGCNCSLCEWLRSAERKIGDDFTCGPLIYYKVLEIDGKGLAEMIADDAET